MAIAIQFDEEELSRDYTEVAVGGPTFETGVIGNPFGIQQRVIRRQDAIRTWEIEFGGLSTAQKQALEDFYITKYGSAIGFRFFPPSDSTFNFDYLGGGDGVRTDFPLYRNYTSPSRNIQRRIVKVVASTAPNIIVFFNGLSTLGPPYFFSYGTNYTIDSNNGVLEFFGAVPSSITDIRVHGGEFDVPVFFDTDKMDVSDYGVFKEWNSIRVTEILPAALGIA